ncbi:MAG: inorganic phosphate transporter, partial [Dehalococcoidales bacterium]|nr:inorganic phosphate transporter [Dehalococcoidales bacterium]
QKPASINQWSRILQLFSAAAYSLGHGGNDAQKTMGIITSLLVAGGLLQTFQVPLWVVLSAHTAIALGTLSG